MARTFDHPDGRRWTITVEGATIVLAIELPDSTETITRTTAHRTPATAAQRAEQLICEQITDGFRELTVPPWRQALDRWLERWRAAGIEVEAPTDPDLAPRMQRLLDLTERLVPDPARGVDFVDLDDAIDDLPKRRAAIAADPGVLPLVLLALRDDTDGSYHRVMQLAGIVRDRAPASAAPMLWSLVEHPPEQPVDAVMYERFAPAQSTEQLLGWMRSANWRVAQLAAWISAQYAADRDELFDELWTRRTTRSPDFWPFAALRACEVRRARDKLPALAAWQTSARGQLRRAIGDTIAAVERS